MMVMSGTEEKIRTLTMGFPVLPYPKTATEREDIVVVKDKSAY